MMFDFRISEVMMSIEETNHLHEKEKEKVDTAWNKLMNGFERFMSVMETDQQELAKNWEKMLHLSK